MGCIGRGEVNVAVSGLLMGGNTLGAEPDEATRNVAENNAPAATSDDTPAAPGAGDAKSAITTKLINSTLPGFQSRVSPVYSLAVHSEAIWALSGLEVNARRHY